MTLDLLHEFANTEVVCLFHNCMWQSRHSEVNVYFLEVSEQTCWLSTHKSPRSCLIGRLHFRLRLCLDVNVQQTLAHNSSQVSLCLRWCFRSHTRHLFRFPEHSNRIVALKQQVSLFLQLDFWFFGWVWWEPSLSPATSESNSFIHLSLQEIFGRGRSDMYTFSYMISSVSIKFSGYNKLGVCRKR